MTGSSDGVIKLFRNYESAENVELVTAFRALTDLESSNKSAGLVFDWQQSSGHILVAGDVRSIRVWNAGTEICTAVGIDYSYITMLIIIQDVNARSGSPITSLTSDQVEGNLVVAGFGDGALRLYDLRQKPQSALQRVWKEHKAWVTNVHLQRGGQRELVSSCRNGEVKLWDLRWDKSVRTIRTTGPKEGLRVLAVHEHAPVFAAGTDGRQVKLFNMNGTLLSHFEPWSQRFLGGSNGGVSAVAFHPHRMMVAGTAIGDTHVNVFACGRKGEKEI
jgi:regulatory associated protein of mTOR